MQDRHIQLLADVLFDFTLKAVENRVAKRAGGDHGLGAAGFRRQNVLTRQLDRNALIVRGGVKAAAFVAPAIVDRPAAEDLGKPFERFFFTGIEKAVVYTLSLDVAVPAAS